MPFPFKIIDLTHTLTNETKGWNGHKGFNISTTLDYDTQTGTTQFRVQRIRMHAGIGTHIDAPAHCDPQGKTIAEISFDQLVAPCIVIDVSKHKNNTYTVSKEDILSFEAQHGTIPEKSFIIIYTGWDHYWSQPKIYRNNHLFPAIAKEVIAYFLERDIVGIGIDTLSPDRPNDGFHAHDLLLHAGKYIIENIAHARHMPTTGGYIMALPLKIHDCTEAPIRLIGLIPH